MASEIYEDIYIKSNNGESNLLTIVATSYQTIIVIVTETGVTIDRGTNGDPFLHGAVTYTYSGSKKFIGISTSANATTPTYGIGSSFNISVTQSILSYYIVEEENPKPTKTFDLSTLNLSAGTHEITVKARASGYADSPASNAVIYVVEGDTVQVSGTWYFNETITFTDKIDQAVSCKYGNTQLVRIATDKNVAIQDGNGDYIAVWCLWYTDSSSAFQAYVDTKGWKNQAYRTITFDGTQTVSKEFYEWLVANATRPISGTWKFNTSPLPTDKTLRQTVNFNSNGDSYTEIYLFYHQVPAFVEFQIKFQGKVGSSGNDSRDNVYQYNSTDSDATFWQNQAYRTVEFVGTQYVSHAFYEWFIANAVVDNEK